MSYEISCKPFEFHQTSRAHCLRTLVYRLQLVPTTSFPKRPSSKIYVCMANKSFLTWGASACWLSPDPDADSCVPCRKLSGANMDVKRAQTVTVNSTTSVNEAIIFTDGAAQLVASWWWPLTFSITNLLQIAVTCTAETMVSLIS